MKYNICPYSIFSFAQILDNSNKISYNFLQLNIQLNILTFS